MAPAFIRTYVPLVVAYVVGRLVSLGVDVSEDQQDVLTGLVGTVAAAGYYAAVRWLERRFPWASRLLGSKSQPVAYAPSAEVAGDFGDPADFVEDDDVSRLGDLADFAEDEPGKYAADA